MYKNNVTRRHRRDFRNHKNMPKTRCMPTKAKISRQLADQARETLKRDYYETSVSSSEPAPIRILNRRNPRHGAGEEIKDAVEEAKRIFEEEFNFYNGAARTPLFWGKPALFQHYARNEIRRTSPSAYHGLLALSDNCDLPGAGAASGTMGQGYYWDAENPVVWECKGGGYCIAFAFARL